MRTITILTTGLVILTVLLTGCSGNKADEVEAKPISQIQAENGIPVRVQKVEATTLEGWSEYTGDVEGSQHVKVFGLLPDNVQQINVKIGDRVEKNQIVAEYATDSPTAQYRQAELALENAEKMYNRMKTVFDAGGISEQDLDNVETQYKVAEENLNATAQMIKVKAPISGTVTEVFVVEGDLVSPADPICEIANTSSLKITIYVDENDIYNYKVGQPVKITWKALPDNVFDGKISKVSLSADPEQRGFAVEIHINSQNGLLKPGAFVTAKIQTYKAEDVIKADRYTIIEENNRKFVYVVSGDKAIKKQVQTGKETGNFVEIISGVNIGETLVIEGQSLLKDGVKVNIVKNEISMK